MDQTKNNLIGPAAACEMLGLNPDTLLRSINDGIVPAYRIGDAVRFRPSELRHPSFYGLAEYYRCKDQHFAA
ncbi:MAG: helix-turn-helix domain-containing protein [Acidimicrobiia bacterium]|nr:helix-turn-helix domain-containing protein [Acidimicrobiia bacterium]MYC57072.1 helix-turn-helix domain-containing protein [Acidimicrobiia bacterium]MYG93679.1 helix-turn-helix domain-containing protein [Acidimicrobiia bacterium]